MFLKQSFHLSLDRFVTVSAKILQRTCCPPGLAAQDITELVFVFNLFTIHHFYHSAFYHIFATIQHFSSITILGTTRWVLGCSSIHKNVSFGAPNEIYAVWGLHVGEPWQKFIKCLNHQVRSLLVWDSLLLLLSFPLLSLWQSVHHRKEKYSWELLDVCHNHPFSTSRHTIFQMGCKIQKENDR